MDKSQLGVGAAIFAGIASIFLIGNISTKKATYNSETWNQSDELPGSVRSLIKQYIESGQNPKGIGSLMPKILSQISVNNQDKGKLMAAITKESSNYDRGVPIHKPKNPKFGGTPFNPLPPLPKGKDEYILRMAPNPNAALTMAHGLGILINELYVEKYKQAGFKSKSVLRLDDTDPDSKPPISEFYENKSSLVFEDYKWISGKSPDITYIASDHHKDHYEGVIRMMTMIYKGRMGGGMAYLVEGKPGTTIESNLQRCRNKSVNDNLEQFQWLIDNQSSFYVSDDGDIIEDESAPLPEIRLRISPGLMTELRDTPQIKKAEQFTDKKIMRLCNNAHPRHSGIRLWPTLSYQGPFDDWALNTSHVVRGADLIEQEDSYHFFYPHVFSQWDDWHTNSQLPEFLYWPRFNFIDMDKYLSYQDPKSGKTVGINTMSSSALAKIVANPPFNGDWKHKDLPTINSLRLKGYKPEEVKRWWFSKFEKKYASKFSNATIAINPLQQMHKDGSPNFEKNWFFGKGIVSIKGLNVNFIKPVDSIRNPSFNDMDKNQIIGYLNNLIQNSSKDVHDWDSSDFETFMSNISQGIAKLRSRDLQF